MKNLINTIAVISLTSFCAFNNAQARPDGWIAPPPPTPITYSATVLSSVSLPGGSPSTFTITKDTFNACQSAVSQFLVFDPMGSVVSSCTQD